MRVGINLLHALPEIGGGWSYVGNLVAALGECDEARSYGVPAVAVAVGGIPEIAVNGEDGLLCQRRDAGTLLQAIEEIRAHYQEFNRYCVANRTRFSSKVCERKMWEPLLRDATSER